MPNAEVVGWSEAKILGSLLELFESLFRLWNLKGETSDLCAYLVGGKVRGCFAVRRESCLYGSPLNHLEFMKKGDAWW